MASEAVVSFLVERLGDLLIKEAQLLHGVQDEFRWIQSELESMRCFLKDADSQQKEDAGVKNWVAQIRDVSYDAEDVIEIVGGSEELGVKSRWRSDGRFYAILLHTIWNWIRKIPSIHYHKQEAGPYSVPGHLTERYELCMKILALSYWDLPYYLKPCFLYLGLFPEDYEIGSGKLIRLWIAEGFIEQRDEIREDTAEKYLKELVSRSMIQVASKRSNGSIKKCRIHDLLRDISISEARENNFFAVYNDNDTSSTSTNVRRLAVYRNIDADETKNNPISTLRSILYFLDSEVEVIKLPNTSSKLLRVMNTESEEFSEVSLPKEVGEFVHLKFLEFSSNYRFSSIPPSIGNLSSLRTLKVLEASKMLDLPNTIWNLKNLRHLRISSNIKGHPHLSNLTNLQTLRLKAGSWIEEGLGKLTNLRKLTISGDVGSYHDTLPYCIEKLRKLRSLKLTGNGDPIPPLMPFTHHLELFEICLCGSIKKLPELPPNLVELILVGSELEQDVISTLEKLQHLKILAFYRGSYLSTRMICSPGGFPRLELLKLCFLPLEEWIVGEGAMISLKRVVLLEMPDLKTEILPERVRGLLKRSKLFK